jgi:hypothetical protein
MVFQISYVYEYKNQIMQATSTSHSKSWKFTHGETQHRKYKRLKLGGGQAYDRLNDWMAVQTELARASSNCKLLPKDKVEGEEKKKVVMGPRWWPDWPSDCWS